MSSLRDTLPLQRRRSFLCLTESVDYQLSKDFPNNVRRDDERTVGAQQSDFQPATSSIFSSVTCSTSNQHRTSFHWTFEQSTHQRTRGIGLIEVCGTKQGGRVSIIFPEGVNPVSIGSSLFSLQDMLVDVDYVPSTLLVLCSHPSPQRLEHHIFHAC
ncbi:hypothetical protein BDN71DRAFT_1456264 [Pleurotus eryngii]|uniref:Uncharacterized protein n=1 Tax=Pleurotus eryngii TaxID=5323 RepID=A0A9P6DA59_PLEER|nr:hypothetical protein BDN71DRAFT_1456264 [Pleurotus eryngii]